MAPKRTNKPKRIAGDDRVELARWVIANTIRLYGLGCPLKDAAKIATEELGVNVNPATLGRTSRFLSKIGAVQYKIRRRRSIGGSTALTSKQWKAVIDVISHLSPWIRTQRWTVPAIQRRLHREKVNAGKPAIIEGLRLAGFVVEPTSSDEWVVWKANQ